MSNEEIIQKLEVRYRMPRPTSFECPDQLYETMTACWKEEPTERPTFAMLFDTLDPTNIYFD